VECLFCGQLESAAHRTDDLIFEDGNVFAFLHEDWSVLGHAVVVWNKHVENLSDLPAAQLQDFMATYSKIEKAVLVAAEADRAVLLKLGLMVPHLHLHIYPVARTVNRAAVIAAIEGKSQLTFGAEQRNEFRRALRELLQPE